MLDDYQIYRQKCLNGYKSQSKYPMDRICRNVFSVSKINFKDEKQLINNRIGVVMSFLNEKKKNTDDYRFPW
jgi:hypothetical protein